MKVILTQEVKGKGREGDVVDVATGFAVNYLLPRKMAVEATKGNMKQLEARQGNIAKRLTERRQAAGQAAHAIEGKIVVIEAKAGDEGRLFGSVTSTMIEDAVADQLGVEVDRRRMDVHGTIKTLGDHVVTVAVFEDVKADLTVRVVAVGQADQAMTEPAMEAQEAEVAEAAEPVAEGEDASAADEGETEPSDADQ